MREIFCQIDHTQVCHKLKVSILFIEDDLGLVGVSIKMQNRKTIKIVIGQNSSLKN